jgi:hypothetical protein
VFALLVQNQIESSTTPYSRGKTVDLQARANSIAAIIGNHKLERFLALERNLGAYSEVHSIGSLLQQNDVPLADTQRDALLKILVETQDQDMVEPPPEARRRSIDDLVKHVAQRDEYERHVLELAPSVLSRKQVQYLSEQYQYLSYARANAVEVQRKARADQPNADFPLWYPAPVW